MFFSPLRLWIVLYALGAMAYFSIGSVFAKQMSRSDASRLHTVLINAVVRKYDLYIPPKIHASASVPLLLVFHGFNQTAAIIQKNTGFNTLADRERFIVAYPHVLKDRWYTDSGPDDATPADVDFVRALIADLKTHYPINPERVYATGFSNGAGITFRLGCELSDQIAAFAPVSSAMSKPLAQHCNPVRPVPIMIINGTADPILTWGGEIKRLKYKFRHSTIVPTPETIRLWTHTDRCNPLPQVSFLPDADQKDRTRVLQSRYTGCQGASQVTQLAIIGGGHTWPGPHRDNWLGLGLVGRTSHDLDASETVWQFFKDRSWHESGQ